MITNQPQQFESGIDGAGPVQWFGPDAPDGDRGPWVSAPVGSMYCKKSATQTTWYVKEKNDGTDNDWSVRWGEIRQTFDFTDFTDGGGAAGTLDLSETLPVGAWVLRAVLRDVTGFTGNTSAVITVGDGTDADRYNTGAPSVYTTANAIDLGAPSGTQIHTATATVRVTVTGGSDFGAITAGQATISIYYLG